MRKDGNCKAGDGSRGGQDADLVCFVSCRLDIDVAPLHKRTAVRDTTWLYNDTEKLSYVLIWQSLLLY